MNREVYRYVINRSVGIRRVESLLGTAVVAVESLLGTTPVRLDARYLVDDAMHACVVDATTEVGKALNRVFVGYLSREIGDEAFTVERIDGLPVTAPFAEASSS